MIGTSRRGSKCTNKTESLGAGHSGVIDKI